jgi:hypothetical protein
MSQIITKVEGGKLFIELPLNGKGLSSSLKSVMVGTTGGFETVHGTEMQVSVNVIREATDEEVIAGAKPDEVRAVIESFKGKTGKKADAQKGRFVRLLDQMTGHSAKPANGQGMGVPGAAVIGGVRLPTAGPARVA